MTPHQCSWGKAIFLVMSVRHSVHRGSHVTITHTALDLIIQGPPSLAPGRAPQTWDMGPHCIITLDMGPCCTRILVTSGGQDWIPVQTCPPEDPPFLETSGGQDQRPFETWSLKKPSPIGTGIWWLLKHVWLASGWYASYLNSFLLDLGSYDFKCDWFWS